MIPTSSTICLLSSLQRMLPVEACWTNLLQHVVSTLQLPGHSHPARSRPVMRLQNSRPGFSPGYRRSQKELEDRRVALLPRQAEDYFADRLPTNGWNEKFSVDLQKTV